MMNQNRIPLIKVPPGAGISEMAQQGGKTHEGVFLTGKTNSTSTDC